MSLLPELRANVLENSKHFDAFRLFEIGREIHKQPKALPREIPHLAAAIYSKDGDGAAGLFEMKRAAECLMPGAETRPCAARPYEHPARAAEIHWHGLVAGRLFELHPSLAAGRTAILDLDLTLVQAAAPKEIRYTPIRRYPSSAFDLSVVAGDRELVGDLHAQLAALAGPLLRFHRISAPVCRAAARRRNQKRVVPSDARLARAHACHPKKWVKSARA